ncbi:hypothetical protein BC937DRAFT_93236 [Endogone sp. FLAS-F59071]|nr:hypothetical protein BC937DRAFT_93236 [Endogone sp. FLAS-F59071]|eukprot:RUS21245.1 hypothetical protein BC937DRAFT_93236 [Endogone sp. FLAS-F59071]
MSLTSFIDLTDMPDMATPENQQNNNQQQIPEQSLLAITPTTLPAQASISTTSTVGVTGGRKRKASLDDKDAKTKERILRNRAAAQESRDKKRRYVTDLEDTNNDLKAENERLSKRVKVVEEENVILSARLESIAVQLSQIQSQLRFNEITQFLFDGFRESAALANIASWDRNACSNVRGNDQHEEPASQSQFPISQQRKPSDRIKVTTSTPSSAALPRSLRPTPRRLPKTTSRTHHLPPKRRRRPRGPTTCRLPPSSNSSQTLKAMLIFFSMISWTGTASSLFCPYLMFPYDSVIHLEEMAFTDRAQALITRSLERETFGRGAKSDRRSLLKWRDEFAKRPP